MSDNCKTLNVKQLAEYLGVGMNTAYQLVNSQDFPTLRLGKRIVIPIDLLEQWIDNHV
ncbi:MAG: helix-turn-helix domain-containing protein [Clostridia bacterium]|nr:helix-turn-helix domain-containing protein [Clostridia bacterium]